MDLRKYQKIFTQESDKYLEQLDRLLMRVEKDTLNCELWAEIHGKIHSIKGMARALSLEKISELSHNMENWCKQFQQGTMNPAPEMVQLLFDGEDMLKVLVARNGEIISAQDQRRYSTLISEFKKDPQQCAIEDQPERRPELSNPFPAEKINYVRVRYSLIEELLGLSQELLLAEKTLPSVSQEQIPAGLKSWIDDYTSILKGLYFRLAQLRLMSVSDFADLFIKPIRNLAKENNKEVRLEVIGGELEADITLLERLREPFIHIFRNSIAHGIESPNERLGMGKDAAGKIIFKASRERDNLIIKISDDGQGINRSAIVKHLKDNKSMTDQQIAKMSQEEFFETILNPGFSSASETTEIGGRGIGMNVVAQAIEYLGGSLSIHSEPAKGAEFRIRLPVSLSIIYAVTFRLGDYTLSIPTSYIASIDQMGPASPDNSHSFYNLKTLLGVGDNGERPFHILKIRSPEEKYYPNEKGELMQLMVDSIVGNKRIMVMPVGELLAKSRLFAGVGIMENCDISLLLDIEQLPKETLVEEYGPTSSYV
jgi:two-component system chemotaxis sensor kinase CheA